MVYCVGLTGNIASGKTSVAHIFSTLGIHVINADRISRELTNINTDAYKEIINHFSSGILLEDGTIDRRKLRTIIFSNEYERLWLENLLHPLIRKEIERQISLCASPYCIVEIPLLINKDNYPYLNKILVITAPLDIQISRVMKRDQCSEKEALAIISTQPSNELRLTNADDVLNNNDDFDKLKSAVLNLHKKYTEESTV